MKHLIATGFVIIISACSFTYAQEKHPSDKQIIMSFLQAVSIPGYRSTLRDFYKFFDTKATDIEGELRHEYLINNPGNELSWDDDSKSFALDQFLNDTTIKRLLMIKKKKNYNWVIFSSYKVGDYSTIYVIGVEHTAGSFQIQFIEWPNLYHYGIREILGPTGKSIYSSIYYKE